MRAQPPCLDGATRQGIGWGLAWSALALMILSGWFAVTRLVVTGNLSVWDVVALRVGVGGLLLLPALVGPGRGLPWRAWRDGAVLAFCWGAPFVLCVAAGLRLTSAADAASITPGLMPVFAAAFAWMTGERFGARRATGFAVIVTGIGLLVFAHRDSGASLVGSLYLIAGAAMWAAYAVRLARGTLTSVQAAALVCVWSAAVYVPLYMLSGASQLGGATWGEIAFQVLYQGVLMSVVAIFAFNRAVAMLGPAAATAIIALIPVLATALAWPILNETPSPLACVAIGVITCGVAFAAFRKPGWRAPETLRLRPTT